MPSTNLVEDAARAKVLELSARLPPAHEDREWLSNIEYRRDTNVRLTRLKFESWMHEAFMAGIQHQIDAGNEAKAAAASVARRLWSPDLAGTLLLGFGGGLLAQAIGYPGLLIGIGLALVALAFLVFAPRI